MVNTVAIILTAIITARLTKPPTVNSVMVFGDVPQAFSTLTVVTAGHTVYVAPGTGDPTEPGAQLQFKSDTVMHELQCISSGAQGTGLGHDVIITARTGPCGHQEDTDFGCTITGAKDPNQSCDSSQRRTVIKGGDCADFRIDTQREVQQPTYVNCTVRFARITEVTPGAGGLPLPSTASR